RSKAESSNDGDSAPATFDGLKRQPRLIGRIDRPAGDWLSANADGEERAVVANKVPVAFMKSRRSICGFPFEVLPCFWNTISARRICSVQPVAVRARSGLGRPAHEQMQVEFAIDGATQL